MTPVVLALLAGLVKESILGCANRGGRGENQNLEFDHVSLDNLHAFGRPFGPHPACAPLRLPSPTRVGEGSRVRAIGKLPLARM